MYLRIAFCLLLLISASSARTPAQGDQIRVTMFGGETYYGTVESLEDGLLSINCTGTSTEKPDLAPHMRYDALTGWRDAGYYSDPSIRPVDPVDLCVGIGSILELAWT